MRQYMELCLEGEPTIPERQRILAKKRHILVQRMEEIQRSIDYVDAKQTFYNDVLAGRVRYFSNLIDTGTPTSEIPDGSRTRSIRASNKCRRIRQWGVSARRDAPLLCYELESTRKVS